MNRIIRVGMLPVALGACAGGCVSLSKYRALKAQENQTAQSLQEAQTQNTALSNQLEAARRQLVDLAVDLRADLAMAQDGISAALKRLDAVDGAGASGPAASAASASVAAAPSVSTDSAKSPAVPQKP